MDPLEQAVLSGALFRDGAADMSEYRHEDRQTPSPEPNTDDELGSDYSPPSSPRAAANDSVSNSRSTGVKGVLKDHKEAARRTREDQIARRLLANEALEERALLGPTWQEDEEQRAFEQTEEGEAVRKWERAPGADGRERPTDGAGAHAARDRKGYLREVSMQGYLSAVEDAPGWVVILIFEPVSSALEELAPDGRADRPALAPRSLNLALQDIPNLPGEYLLTLQSLASSHPPPNHTFLLARSSTLSFLLNRDGQPDHDVLPSMLVYAPGGMLRHTFIRLDMEMKGKKGGIERLLRRCTTYPHLLVNLAVPKTNDRLHLSSDTRSCLVGRTTVEITPCPAQTRTTDTTTDGSSEACISRPSLPTLKSRLDVRLHIGSLSLSDRLTDQRLCL